jgi:hypothetical protein
VGIRRRYQGTLAKVAVGPCSFKGKPNEKAEIAVQEMIIMSCICSLELHSTLDEDEEFPVQTTFSPWKNCP